jgi:primosomal protein N' (replication factor Y)
VAHVPGRQSICHYCHVRVATPEVCPDVSCGAKLVHVGLGTQRVEDALAAGFPGARVARVDSDTMRHRDQYRRIVDEFSARSIDVLVGTQMIAKGLDFPFVSFVGVVHADAAGLAADFRAHERLFQLITQVAGRAGRADATGQVVVQTSAPELPALRLALAHDYENFAGEELAVRRRVGLPPFRRLARIILSDRRESRVRAETAALVVRVTETIARLGLEHADVLGPNPCALARLRGQYRYDLLVRTHTATALRELMREMDQARALRTKAESTIIDVDPVAMV